MNLFTKIALVLSFTLALTAPAAAQLRVFAQIESGQDIYAGERFTYYVIIDGVSKPAQVDVSTLKKFSPQSAGGQNLTQNSISIINGRRTETSTKRYMMMYKLLVADPGITTLTGVDVTVDGQTYRTNAVDVKVLTPGSTDRMEMELSLSKDTCFTGEPIVMTVKWFIRKTVASAVGDFAFNVPLLATDRFYVEDIDSRTVSAQPTTNVNGFPVMLVQQPVKRSGLEWIEVSFAKVLIPKRSGDISIDPAIVSVDIAVGQKRRGFFGFDRQYKRFMARSNALQLNVLPLPPAGAAEDQAGFYGLVGDYEISATATPTQVYVGDPITLTIKIGGTKYLKPVQRPDLKKIEAFTQNFKLPSAHAEPTIENGYKVFVQTIRANNDSFTQIPSIPLAYFDATRGKYVITRTGPIKLDVSPTTILTAADAEGRTRTTVNREVQSVKKGIAANYEDLTALQDQAFSVTAALVTPGFLAIWLLPLLLLLITAAVKLLGHTTPQRIAANTRKQARAKAIAQLKKALAVPDAQKRQLVVSAMRQFIGDRFDKTAGSLTGADCEREILNATGDAAAALDYRKSFESCQASYYAGPTTQLGDAEIKQIITLIKKIDTGAGR